MTHFGNQSNFMRNDIHIQKNKFVKGKLKVCKNPPFLLPLIFFTEYLQQPSNKKKLNLGNYPMLIAFINL